MTFNHARLRSLSSMSDVEDVVERLLVSLSSTTQLRLPKRMSHATDWSVMDSLTRLKRNPENKERNSETVKSVSRVPRRPPSVPPERRNNSSGYLSLCIYILCCWEQNCRNI